MSKETKEANGIAFPLDDKGQRSTTVAAKAIWSKCLESVQGQEQAVAQLQAEKNWRHGILLPTMIRDPLDILRTSSPSRHVPQSHRTTYPPVRNAHTTAHGRVESAFICSGDRDPCVVAPHHRFSPYAAACTEQLVPGQAMAIVNAGLSAVYDTFEFVRDGKSMKLEEAMQTYAEQPAFYTGKFTGTGAPADIAMEVPLHGNTLRGDALVKQIDRSVLRFGGAGVQGSGDGVRAE
eukprot:2920066-Rhodomonas_salina.1